LAKNEIRLQYSGFMIFLAKIISVGTGLIFQFIVARTTSDAEYGIWFNINDIATYFTLLAGILPFWAMRFISRNKEGALKTGIIANFLISALAAAIYLPAVPLIASALDISQTYLVSYFLVALQIMELYSVSALESSLQARMPQAIGYGLLVQQFFKIIVGYVFIIELNQPILGAVLATILAFVVQIAYYVKLVADEFRQRIRWEYVKEWFKGSVANIYNVVGNQIASFIFIMLFQYGGKEARATYGAAAQVTGVINHATFLAYALYPKLLAERKSEDITVSLKMVLMFAIPMTVGAIVLSDSYIVLLKPDYAGAWSVLIALAIDAFIAALSGFFSSVLLGVETVDEKAKISFRQLAKSRLFIAFSLPYLHSLITIPTAFYILTFYVQNMPVEASLWVSIINAVGRFAMLVVLFAIVRKMIKIEIPWRNIAKYVFATVVMATVLFIIPHPTRISLILAATGIGGLIYLVLLMAIDREARTLPRTILNELKGKGR
jgi:O-antigen/teichoic acid export membrane protein